MKKFDDSGYIQIPRSLWRIKFSSGGEALMLLALYYCDQNGVRTSRKQLSRISSLSLRSVDRCLTQLVNRGFLTKEIHKDENGANLPTTYTINGKAIFSAYGDKL
jgi:hypothetical protein